MILLGCLGQARRDFERAASLTRKAREHELLLERARAAVTKAARLTLCTHSRRADCFRPRHEAPLVADRLVGRGPEIESDTRGQATIGGLLKLRNHVDP
jgi:hypothetical protein